MHKINTFWVSGTYGSTPYSTSTRHNRKSKPLILDIDALIAVTTNQVQEIEDELWLLHTESSFFLDQATLVEKNWCDTRPGMQGFDESPKYCNIALSVSYQRFYKARSWRWLLDDLHNVKKEHDKWSVEARTARILPLEYGLTLSCLDSSLSDVLRNGSRVDLKKYFGTAPSLQKYWKFAQEAGNPKLYTTEMKESDRLDVLFEKDRLMWCLYLVTLHPTEQTEDDIPLVLRHLDVYLDTCSRAEAGRINSVMYSFISNLIDSAASNRLYAQATWAVLSQNESILCRDLEPASVEILS